MSALWVTNPSPWPCHCRPKRLGNLDGAGLLCGACQTWCEAHCSCPELKGASTRLGVSIPEMLLGAALASPGLGFSAEHNWCTVGHMGCIWGSQEVHRALTLLRVSQQLHSWIFGVLTLLLCSAKGQEKSYLQTIVLSSQCCGPLKDSAGHGGVSAEDDSSVKAILCMLLSLAWGASGCSFASSWRQLYFTLQKGLVLLLCVCTSLMAPKAQYLSL